MVPQWGVWDGGAPVYFMFPGVACADIVRFRCRFGNAAINETGTANDGLVNAVYDDSVGALVCTAPPAPLVSASVPAVTVTVQLLANGVPLASTRPLLYTYRRVSVSSAMTASATTGELPLSPAQRDLLMRPQRYLCELCAASVPEALSAASIPTAAAASDPSIVDPSDFSGMVVRSKQ